MLGALFSKIGKTGSSAKSTFSYIPREKRLASFTQSVSSLCDELESSQDAIKVARSEQLRAKLNSFLSPLSLWETRKSDKVTDKFLLPLLKQADKADGTFNSYENLRVRSIVVSRMGAQVDSTLGILKRNFDLMGVATKAEEAATDSGSTGTLQFTATWNNQEGLPSDVSVDVPKGLEEAPVSFSYITNVVETYKSTYPTLTGVEYTLSLGDVKVSQPRVVKYSALSTRTSTLEKETKTFYDSVIATPKVEVTLSFIGEENVSFDLDSASRLAIAAFTKELSVITRAFDSLIISVSENLRFIENDLIQGDSVMDKMMARRRVEAANVAQQTTAGSSDNSQVVTPTVENNDAQNDTPQTNEEGQTTETSNNEELTTDGRDVEITTPEGV